MSLLIDLNVLLKTLSLLAKFLVIMGLNNRNIYNILITHYMSPLKIVKQAFLVNIQKTFT